MKKNIYIKLITLIILLGSYNNLFSQADTLMSICSKHFTIPFVSDGQQYRTLIAEDETAEFKVTFYGGSTYRIVGCTGLSDGNLIFSLYDKERNELFSNKDYNNSPYWDFKFKSTIDCVIEAKLSGNSVKSGFAIILIGFKP